ncbi:MAG TPA: DUF1801 domain-containing protein [Planctomycetota bacterium]|nr:DUF1801 domain-containing protein [Planctomycetota bacterium]
MKTRSKPGRRAKAAKKAPRGKASRAAAKRTAAEPARARKLANGPRKMKAYATFDLYLADQPALHQRLISVLRRFVRRVAPELAESVKWGNGCWLAGKAPVAYVYAAPDHVHFGFLRGAAFADPQGLLHGQGQYVRHVKVHRLADIDEPAFTALLRQATR